jgi:hypothetical protein
MSTSTSIAQSRQSDTPMTCTRWHWQRQHVRKTARTPRGPKLSFTSAKTGVGVLEVFAYVVMRWEWEAEAVYVDVLVLMVATAPAYMLFLMRPGKREKGQINFILSTVPTSTVSTNQVLRHCTYKGERRMITGWQRYS